MGRRLDPSIHHPCASITTSAQLRRSHPPIARTPYPPSLLYLTPPQSHTRTLPFLLPSLLYPHTHRVVGAPDVLAADEDVGHGAPARHVGQHPLEVVPILALVLVLVCVVFFGEFGGGWVWVVD